jgi:hypothetical protein
MDTRKQYLFNVIKIQIMETNLLLKHRKKNTLWKHEKTARDLHVSIYENNGITVNNTEKENRICSFRF